LPQFLPTIRVGAPAVGVFFQIFVSEHGLEGSPPMVEIKHLFDQEPIDGQCCDEEFVDPFTDTLPH
jgi:hypothetical protein